MSRRWNGYLSPSHAKSSDADQHLDLAAKYVALLEVMHAKCLDKPDIPTEKLFQYDIMSDLPAIRGRAATSPYSISDAGEGSTAMWREGNLTPAIGPSPISDRELNLNSPYVSGDKPFHNPVSPGRMPIKHAPNTQSRQDMGMAPGTPIPGMHYNQPSVPTGLVNLADGISETTEDELTVMSNVLLDQQFSELDRVIMFDGTDFAFDMSYWGNLDRNRFP